jgi:hypothetical protein
MDAAEAAQICRESSIAVLCRLIISDFASDNTMSAGLRLIVLPCCETRPNKDSGLRPHYGAAKAFSIGAIGQHQSRSQPAGRHFRYSQS